MTLVARTGSQLTLNVRADTTNAPSLGAAETALQQALERAVDPRGDGGATITDRELSGLEGALSGYIAARAAAGALSGRVIASVQLDGASFRPNQGTAGLAGRIPALMTSASPMPGRDYIVPQSKAGVANAFEAPDTMGKIASALALAPELAGFDLATLRAAVRDKNGLAQDDDARGNMVLKMPTGAEVAAFVARRDAARLAELSSGPYLARAGEWVDVIAADLARLRPQLLAKLPAGTNAIFALRCAIADLSKLADPSDIMAGVTRLTLPQTADEVLAAQPSVKRAAALAPGQTYGIVAGDTLDGIARDFLKYHPEVMAALPTWLSASGRFIAVKKALQLNGTPVILNPAQIAAGAKIRMPSAAEVAERVARAGAPYRVAPGDTLWQICAHLVNDPAWLEKDIAKSVQIVQLRYTANLQVGQVLSL